MKIPEKVKSHPSIRSKEFFGRCFKTAESVPKIAVARMNTTTNPTIDPPKIPLVFCRLNLLDILSKTPIDKKASKNSRNAIINTGNIVKANKNDF